MIILLAIRQIAFRINYLIGRSVVFIWNLDKVREFNSYLYLDLNSVLSFFIDCLDKVIRRLPY